MKQKKAWLAALTVLLVFAAAVWSAGWLKVAGRDLWIVRGGLAVLGIAAAVLIFLYVAARSRRMPAAPDAPDEIAEAMAAAEARLASSALAGSSRIASLPVVLVMGPAGSAKTSTVVHSGTEPELLAGEVERGGAVVPTQGINVWYARDTLFLEPGAGVVDDDGRWARLVRHLQPSRLAAALARGAQAPRAAVVCFACDELLRPGAADAVPAAARRIRARLAGLAQELGVRLPVYVLFTRADRIPYFADYVRGMTRDEAREVLGATFPLADAPAAGLYAEFAARRAGEALRAMQRSLALAQLDLLPREAREEARGGAYEFPRELRKVSELATHFLVEVCRPSPLHVSPFLRGFYFSGVRTVLASAGDEADAAGPAPGPGQVALGASGVFGQRSLLAPQPAPVARGSLREVAEWAFGPRVFGDVILRDRAAMAATAGGTRVNALRRTLAVSVAAAALVAAVGFTVSWSKNRGLLARSVEAAREAQAAPVDPAALASLNALRRLDALRGDAATIGRYTREGAPLWLTWGLFAGDDAFPHLRRVYFATFDRQLWTRTRSALVAALDNLPAEPNEASEYTRTYDDLKAYLITTSHPQHGTAEFMDTVLARHWAPASAVDAARLEVARRQFAFFGAELPRGNPFQPTLDDRRVAASREFLGKFARSDAIYRILLSEAAAHSQNVSFGREFPLAGRVVADLYEVPGPFTRDGWAYVRGHVGDVERLLKREDWVLGPQTVSPGDRARLERELQARYLEDYVGHWRSFLGNGRVLPFAGLEDAVARLEPLSGNNSPILQLLSLVSKHTAVDSAQVGVHFQPVHAAVPPTLTDRVAGDATAGYLLALGNLRSALQQAVTAPLAQKGQALNDAGTAAGAAEAEARKLAQEFRTDAVAGSSATAVQALLRAPIQYAQGVIDKAKGEVPTLGADGRPPPDPNAAAAHFCRGFAALADLYPFSPSAGREAELDDVAAVFQPGNSALVELLGNVSGVVVRQGRRWEPKMGADPPPTAAFRRFLGAATDFSGALYDPSGAGPEVVFRVRPQTSPEIPEVGVTFEGRTRRFTRTFAASEPFEWHGGAGDAQVTALVGGAEVVVAQAAGGWAPFRLFAQGQWQAAGDGHWLVRWRVPGAQQPLVLDVTFARGVPVFDPSFLRGLSCVSRMVS